LKDIESAPSDAHVSGLADNRDPEGLPGHVGDGLAAKCSTAELSVDDREAAEHPSIGIGQAHGDRGPDLT